MRYKFSTFSGSEYMIDDTAGTWKRRNVQPGHEDILGYDKDAGTLDEFPDIYIGERAFLYTDGTCIRTTPVMRIELLDFNEEN